MKATLHALLSSLNTPSLAVWPQSHSSTQQSSCWIGLFSETPSLSIHKWSSWSFSFFFFFFVTNCFPPKSLFNLFIPLQHRQANITSLLGSHVVSCPISGRVKRLMHTWLCHTPAYNEHFTGFPLFLGQKLEVLAVADRGRRIWSDPPLPASLLWPPQSSLSLLGSPLFMAGLVPRCYLLPPHLPSASSAGWGLLTFRVQPRRLYRKVAFLILL